METYKDEETFVTNERPFFAHLRHDGVSNPLHVQKTVATFDHGQKVFKAVEIRSRAVRVR